MIDTVESFIDELVNYPQLPDVFNPWREFNPDYDIGQNAPHVRKKNLTKYLEQRVPHAEYLLVAEALGYQGGRFSGIALTSERILIGKYKNIPSSLVYESIEKKERTSNPKADLKKASRKSHGFAEQTATIVWDFLINHNLDVNKVILWNIFPFHPFDRFEGPLSNRTPNVDELAIGIQFVKKLVALNPNAKVVAIGEHSHKTLTQHSIENYHVAHPANGGAQEFRSEFKTYLEKTGSNLLSS